MLSTAAPPLSNPASGPADSPVTQTFGSRHQISANERDKLDLKYAHKTLRSGVLNRRLVSYQGNKGEPGYRWMKFKEGFSRELVETVIKETRAKRVLDPFSGIGTTALTAAAGGVAGTGIELMPVGNLVANAIRIASNNEVDVREFEATGSAMIKFISSADCAASEHRYRHIRITENAFPPDTEGELALAREFLSNLGNNNMFALLNFACMSVLEDVSFTRKDGQYLRWDYRSGRRLKSHVDKGPVLSLPCALKSKVEAMCADMSRLQSLYRNGKIELIEGSCLERLIDFGDASFDLIITSPPYANRYDYTRTYALELAWLGLGQTRVADLRQQLLTATVENYSKRGLLESAVGERPTWRTSNAAYRSHPALNEVLGELRLRRNQLSNPNVIRLLEGYFMEMAYVISELTRVLEPGGTVVMVNDNVQYHGQHVPVDQILSDFAEGSGLVCERILTLPRGKGNSSQQMGRFGRRELRKCVYVWRKPRGTP